jgi:hypothetical protein
MDLKDVHAVECLGSFFKIKKWLLYRSVVDFKELFFTIYDLNYFIMNSELFLSAATNCYGSILYMLFKFQI